jgi:UDP-N-acetylglucosamine diphosphorylase / glucose-1-phosphate thymidylyltransferase / UDP-N-acetylgalactosamine diphosphorylase / glucosamine-1-phosphate N-acetyltransferase / galactosamine-1-phosphate N-acetyltransferase
MNPYFSATAFFDLTQTAHAGLWIEGEPVWAPLNKIKDYLRTNLRPGFHGEKMGEPYLGNEVYVGAGTVIEHGAVLKGPAWIGRDCQIRSGAYVRENVIVGDGCVLGNSCEFKNCLLFNECEVPHFTYVGDSILGFKVHLGAGVILSNYKFAKDEIVVRHQGYRYPSGLRKFGAILGDHVEVGCQSVLNPGSIIGRNALIYPGVIWRGVLESGAVVKSTTP